MWGAMICPSGNGVPWAPATGGTPWAGVGSDVGVFRAASLAGEWLGFCPAFCVNESRKRPNARREAARLAVVHLAVLQMSALTNKNYSLALALKIGPRCFGEQP